ncbi:MAG: hypothetical protein V3U85_04270 [Hyphomicrobium sp.]
MLTHVSIASRAIQFVDEAPEQRLDIALAFCEPRQKQWHNAKSVHQIFAEAPLAHFAS